MFALELPGRGPAIVGEGVLRLFLNAAAEVADGVVEKDGIGLQEPAGVAAAIVDLDPALLIAQNAIIDAGQRAQRHLLALFVGSGQFDAGLFDEDGFADPGFFLSGWLKRGRRRRWPAAMPCMSCA